MEKRLKSSEGVVRNHKNLPSPGREFDRPIYFYTKKFLWGLDNIIGTSMVTIHCATVGSNLTVPDDF